MASARTIRDSGLQDVETGRAFAGGLSILEGGILRCIRKRHCLSAASLPFSDALLAKYQLLRCSWPPKQHAPFPHPAARSPVRCPLSVVHCPFIYLHSCVRRCPASCMWSKLFCRSASYSTIATELERFSDRISLIIGIRTAVS